jgi:NDP-sugar pyrophosphorylase family protein
MGLEHLLQLRAGTAGDGQRAVPVEDLDSTFLVTNGDVLTTLDLKDRLAFHMSQGGIVTIAVHERQVKIDLGVVQWNGTHYTRAAVDFISMRSQFLPEE